MGIEQKLFRLKKIISDCGSVLVAFSGGADSTFLLKTALDALPKEKVLAVTAFSPVRPKEELFFSKGIARSLSAPHRIIKTYELKNKKFISNTVKRCYFCKLELFSKLKTISAKLDLNVVADGTCLSDRQDFRPGSLAGQELKIRPLLLEAGLAKEDIRRLSRMAGLITWNKPSSACLVSRIPYGTRISRALLGRIDRAEAYLKKLGFAQIRLRHYDGLCRIEVSGEDIERLIKERVRIVDRLKKIGYNYITLDLEGYRTGSLNEVMSKGRFLRG